MPRLAADLARCLAQSLLIQELISVENPAIAVAADAWEKSFDLGVSGCRCDAERWFDAIRRMVPKKRQEQ